MVGGHLQGGRRLLTGWSGVRVVGGHLQGGRRLLTGW